MHSSDKRVSQQQKKTPAAVAVLWLRKVSSTKKTDNLFCWGLRNLDGRNTSSSPRFSIKSDDELGQLCSSERKGSFDSSCPSSSSSFSCILLKAPTSLSPYSPSVEEEGEPGREGGSRGLWIKALMQSTISWMVSYVPTTSHAPTKCFPDLVASTGSAVGFG